MHSTIYLFLCRCFACMEHVLYSRGEANVQTRNNQRIWQYLQRHRVISIVTGNVVVACVLGLVLLGNAFGSTILGVFAQSPCSSGDRTYVVVGGDTLGVIASRYGTSWQRLTSYNKLSNPNMIYIDQHICIPGGGSHSGGNKAPVAGGPPPARGMGNFYPYPQCTWWAAQRFFQLHGVFVPWTFNADAWAWQYRAKDFHWRVSSSPSAGAIIDLQPWVQGAYGLGHVAVVERVLSNGNVLASNMNWGAYPYSVTDVEFSPGPGVTFITV